MDAIPFEAGPGPRIPEMASSAGAKWAPRAFVMREKPIGWAPACPNFVNEMALYEWEERGPSSRTRRNAPESGWITA